MSAQWFKVTDRSGAVTVGPVQGRGGKIQEPADSALPRLEGAQRLAAKGRETGIYEPTPGCIAVYPEFCAAGDGEPVIVALSGATFEVIAR